MNSYFKRYGIIGLAALTMCTTQTQGDSLGNKRNLIDAGADVSSERGYDVTSRNDVVKEILYPLVQDEQLGVQILLEEIVLSTLYKGKANVENIEIILENPATGNYDLTLVPDVLFWKQDGDTFLYLEFVSNGEKGKNVSSDFPFYREIAVGTEKEIREKMKQYLNEKK